MLRDWLKVEISRRFCLFLGEFNRNELSMTCNGVPRVIFETSTYLLITRTVLW